MGKIQILPSEVINKIAAGEVIERPASVVKELIENSLDAGTSSVELNVKHSGKVSIQVKDTGSGIDPDDLEKIFHRHATSKIASIDDLFTLDSLGFRGEALYSIGAVSDITVKSKTKSADAGWELHVRDGKKLSIRPISFAEGTEIEVRELFFNTPARKKFLKSNTTEFNHIIDLFMPYAILSPGIRFKLTHNDKVYIELPEEKNHIERISKALNIKKEHILKARKEFAEEKIEIQLFLGDINIQRVTRDMQFLFVNNRPVQSRSLSFHLNQIYRLIFPKGIYPFFAVSITMPPEDIDVNVHPAKREIKIKNEQVLFSLIRPLCEETLMSYGKAKQVNERIFIPADTPPLHKTSLAFVPSNFRQPPQKAYLHSIDEQKTIQFEENNLPPTKDNNLKNRLSSARYIGTLQKKYILMETETSLLIIDQHAAHERINYEKFKKQIETGSLEIQQLLTPVLIGLNHQEMLTWEESKEKLESLGLSTTRWDKETIALHSHPHLINKPEISIRNVLSGESFANIDIDIIIRRACRQAIMFGDEIKKELAEFLKQELLLCADPFSCPHGRPVVIEIQNSFLNKQFLRSI